MNTILYRIFLTCLTICASFVITMVWTQAEHAPEPLPQILVTTFVTGLASFLLWFTRLFRDLHTQVTKKEY
jgi:uncharacterized membrane protein